MQPIKYILGREYPVYYLQPLFPASDPTYVPRMRNPNSFKLDPNNSDPLNPIIQFAESASRLPFVNNISFSYDGPRLLSKITNSGNSGNYE